MTTIRQIINEQEELRKELTMLDKANLAWQEWANENNVHATNTTRETYVLMHDAFVDGYLSGFTKRFTEGE